MKLQSVQNTSRTNIMRKKRERKHRSKVSHSVTLSPCLVLSSSLEQTKSINDELSEKRVDQRKERSRLAAQIRRNREGQSLMLIQNALPISSHVLGLNLIQQNSKSSNSINGTKQINQPSENNNMITPGTIGRGQKKTAYFNSTVSNTMTGFLTTTSTATTTETSSSTISNIPSAINLEKARVLRIAGHTLFLLNKLSSYLRLQAKLYLSLNSQSVYGMLIDSKEMRIAYATPALAKAIGWSWIKLLGAPLHKLIKPTETSENSTETITKLSSKSQYSPLISPSHFNTTMKTPITHSFYPIHHEASCMNLTSNNSNNECINTTTTTTTTTTTDNEFILPEFITLLKSNPNDQHLLCTSKNSKLDETVLNSSLMSDNNNSTTFSNVSDINRNGFIGNITKTHRIINSDHSINHKMNIINKSIRKSSSTPLISSKLVLNRFIPGNTIDNNNCNSDDINDYDPLNKKSFPQNNNDNELICYCWSKSMINIFTDNSTGLSEISNSLHECDVNNISTDDSNYINGDNDDYDDKSLLNNELLDILMKDAFSPDSLTFESSWGNSNPSSTINNPCNSCDGYNELSSTLSTGLYLCLLQPVCNKISSFEDLTNRVNSIINDTEYNHNNTISNDSNDNNINGEVNQNNLLDPSIHILEDLQKSATNDKQDSSISFELHNNINIMQSEESLMELSDIDTTSSSLLNGSTSMKIPSLEQKKECIKSKSFQCHTYLNCALTIKMVQGNYTDCFDIEDQSDIVDYSYLEFIHPDDLQNVITIFTRITHTNSLAWISPYRVSAHNKTVNNNTEKSYRWIRSLVSYDKMKNIFICSNQFLGSCELYDCAVGSNQRLLSVTFENSFKQFELKINNTTNNSNISSQNFMRTFNYDPSNESSINSRYHQQPKSKQVRISNSSSRSVRLKKSPTSLVIKNSNIIKPIKLFPFQSSQYIKQQSGQGYNQIISGNNQIRSIRLLPFTTTNNNKVPCLSYLNTHLYDSSKANDNSYTRQTNSVLNISTTKSSLYHSPSNVSSVPYYVKSMLPVVNYTSSSSKKLIFLSSASSLPSSISINKLQTFNTSNISRNKFRNDNKRGKYIEYSAISQDNNPTSLHYKNNIPFSDSSINDLYNQMIFGPDNNKTSNPIKLTVKTVCNDHQWNSGDNWSPSLIDNSSPHSVYSSHGSSTSISLSPNEQNLTDLNVSMQMETTVSELLESIPLSNKLSYDNDGVQMNIDFNGNSYDSNTFEYEDSELSHLDSDFESSENFTGFQPDLISDSDVLNSPV